MSNYIFAPGPSRPEQNSTFITWENGFTSEELNQIEDYCEQNLVIDKATVFGKDKESDYVEIRKSKTGWMSLTNKNQWFYDKIAFIARQLNSKFYDFDLYGFSEDMQYTVYDKDGDHYDWHIDAGNSTVPRKLSLVLLLTDPTEYLGGDLQFMTNKDIITATPARGLVIGFPGFRLHRVTPVTSGVRKSIVIWISGPSFR